jgi:hypothetical protein
MSINEFIQKINQTPNIISFTESIAIIDANYQFTATAFKNGELHNEAGQNSGSCKLFSFAKLHDLNTEQTLACFGDFYRTDVLQHPDSNDHQNIRNFIKFGWDGIIFFGSSLAPM